MKALAPFIDRRLLCIPFSSAFRNVSGLAAAWVTNAKPEFLNEDEDPTDDTLYRRIYPAIREPSIIPLLNQWVNEGRPVNKYKLVTAAKSLRKYGRFNHALQVLHWMNNTSNMHLSAGDIAIQLDLISKVHGNKQVEEFFYNLPKEHRSLQTYCALLNCYANEMLVEKAEALVQEMTDSGISMTSLCYSAMFKLYYQLGDYVKVDALVQEMEQKGVMPNRFIYGIILSLHGRESDSDGIKKTIQKAESDQLCNLDSAFYTSAANWYYRAGHLGKGVECLRKAEKLLAYNKRDVTLNHLLTLYATGGRKDDVLRIWDQCKSYKAYNRDYLCMITSVLKFDDFEVTERILNEWESSGLCLDMHVPNLLISALCKKGLVEKAETVLNRLVELKGMQPNSYTRSFLSDAYIKEKRMPEAVEAIKSAVQVSTPKKWKPCVKSLVACFSYLIAEKDRASFEELAGLLRSKGYVSEELHCKLLGIGLDGGQVKDSLKEDMGVSVEESLESCLKEHM